MVCATASGRPPGSPEEISFQSEHLSTNIFLDLNETAESAMYVNQGMGTRGKLSNTVLDELPAFGTVRLWQRLQSRV